MKKYVLNLVMNNYILKQIQMNVSMLLKIVQKITLKMMKISNVFVIHVQLKIIIIIIKIRIAKMHKIVNKIAQDIGIIIQ